MDLELEGGMNDEDYDAINAPQFLDFSLLDMNSDDDEADRFFETHKEEDDHFIPVENLSPTIQLMRESGGSDFGNPGPSTSSFASTSLTKIQGDDCNTEIKHDSPIRPCGSGEQKLSNVSISSIQSFGNVHAAQEEEESEGENSPLKSLGMADIERVNGNGDSSFEEDNDQSENSKENFHVDIDFTDGVVENETPDDKQEEIVESSRHSNSKPKGPARSPLQTKLLNSSFSEKPAHKEIPSQLIKRPIMALHSKYTTKVTVPQPFNLHQTRPRTHTEPKESEFKFKARPVPIKALQGPTIKRKNEIKVTESKAPHFASEDRIRERQEKKAATLSLPTSPKDGIKKSGPSSTASSSRSFRPPTPKKVLPPTPTKVQPFSFAERDEELKRRKEQKIQEELEKKMEHFTFHAKPLPSFKPKLPKKLPIELTNVEPFKLHSDERGELYRQAWKSKLEKEEQQLRETKVFHANPPTVLYKKPFEPVLGLAPLAEPLDIQLNTDRRAQEREQYEVEMREKHGHEEEQRLMEEEMRKEQERQEQIRHRQQLVHKANPLKPFRAFQVKASDKPLTNPQSPAFAPLPSQRRGLEKGKHPSNGSLNTAV